MTKCAICMNSELHSSKLLTCAICLNCYHYKCSQIEPKLDWDLTIWYCKNCITALLPFNHIVDNSAYMQCITENINKTKNIKKYFMSKQTKFHDNYVKSFIQVSVVIGLS